jgi:hypothetical protein
VLLREAGIEPRVRGVHLHDNMHTLQPPPFSLSRIFFFFCIKKGGWKVKGVYGEGKKRQGGFHLSFASFCKLKL